MEKKKIRFNIIDVLIIVLVLAAMGVIGYVLLAERGDVVPQNEKVKINYVLMVTEMRAIYAENVKVGDEVYDQESNKYIGKVIQVSTTASKRTGTDRKTGEQVISELENRRDLYITVEAEADHVDNSYVVSGLTVVAGAVVNFISPALAQPANIISVETVSA